MHPLVSSNQSSIESTEHQKDNLLSHNFETLLMVIIYSCPLNVFPMNDPSLSFLC
jgi:hypothetical protein